MRKVIGLVLALTLIVGFKTYAETKTAYVYKDKGAAENKFIPSGWMGDHGDLRLNDQYSQAPYSGATSLEIEYSAKRSQNNGWSGVYWQSSEHNWGAKDTGYDLTDFNKLVFMAKGKNGGEIITKVKVGGISEGPEGTVEFPDSANIEYGPVRLTKEWQEYSINLSGKDLSYINGGLALIFDASHAQSPQTIYLDEIRYVYQEGLDASEKSVDLPFYVYSDSNSLDNHFIPSGWMPATAARDIKMNTTWKSKPFSGDTCIKAEYRNNSGARWAGVYWQQPANNWGSVPDAGFNLQGAKKLTFWARGETGTEIINEFKMGGIASGEFIDSDSVSIGPINLTKEWQKYEVDLQGRDLSYIIGGFGWATNIDVNDQAGIVFYIDEIKYE